MPEKQPILQINTAVAALPRLQLYLQLYREQYTVLLAKAIEAGLCTTVAAVLVHETFVCLYEEQALLTDTKKADAFVNATLDAFVLSYLAGSSHYLPATHTTVYRLYNKGFTERAIAARTKLAFALVKRRLSFSLFLLKTQFAKKPKAPV